MTVATRFQIANTTRKILGGIARRRDLSNGKRNRMFRQSLANEDHERRSRIHAKTGEKRFRLRLDIIVNPKVNLRHINRSYTVYNNTNAPQSIA